jgi:AraC-like DNA-binding protein/effector-binding domain-containing protein
MAALKRIQPALAYAASHLDEDVSLATLARQAGLSVFHLQRAFSTAAGETPKQFTLRLRLGRAAAMLLTREDSILEIALECGFQSHEVFCRAFRRRFGMSPSLYRRRGFVHATESIARDHAAVVDDVSPCIGLYHLNEQKRSAVPYIITKREISPTPVLIMRHRVKRSEIAPTIGRTLHAIFLYSQKNGIALGGPPFARYPEASIGFVTIEPGTRIAAEAPSSEHDASIIHETLPGGPVVFTTHSGPYEGLPEAHAAMETWIQTEGLTPAGAPWESYVTDPGDYPDPKDWKTELFWPVAR